MKIPGVEFECAACEEWSEDNEFCVHCGARMPPSDLSEGVFVPGIDQMPEQERSAAILKAMKSQSRRAEQFRIEQELRRSDPDFPDDERTRCWIPTHIVKDRRYSGQESPLMLLPNGQAFTEDDWMAYVKSPVKWSLYFRTPWSCVHGCWIFNGEKILDEAAVVPID